MSWRDELLPGSFRGVPFHVRSHDTGGGRRTAPHEYPLRDDPFEEDLGRKQREFSIDVYLVGSDYMGDRDSLIDACESPGSGQLNHPYLGIKTVVCRTFRLQESVEEGGMVRFSLTFAEAGEKKFPSSAADFFSRLGSAVEALKNTVQNGFSLVFDVLALPEYVATKAASLVRDLGGALGSIAGIANGFTGLARAAQGLIDDAADLVRTPSLLAEQIVAAIASIGDTDLDFGAIASAHKELFRFGDDLGTDFSPAEGEIATSRRQNNINTRAIIDLTKQLAVAGAAIAAAEKARQSPGSGQITSTIDTPLDPLEVSPTRLFPTYESAIQEREIIFEVLDDQLERTTNDDVYMVLQKLRNAIAKAVPDAASDLPNLVDFENKETQPSLRLAYELYENLDFEIDLLKRNRVENPGFIPGGSILQVIRNG